MKRSDSSKPNFTLRLDKSLRVRAGESSKQNRQSLTAFITDAVELHLAKSEAFNRFDLMTEQVVLFAKQSIAELVLAGGREQAKSIEASKILLEATVKGMAQERIESNSERVELKREVLNGRNLLHEYQVVLSELTSSLPRQASPISTQPVPRQAVPRTSVKQSNEAPD